MEKISLQLAFIILFVIPYCQPAGAMLPARARVVPPLHALLPLKNGAQANSETIFDTHQTVIAIIENKGGFAIRELIENCRNSASQISTEAGKLLHQYGLVNQEYWPHGHLINIILSMAKGNENQLRIVNPIDYALLEPQ